MLDCLLAALYCEALKLLNYWGAVAVIFRAFILFIGLLFLSSCSGSPNGGNTPPPSNTRDAPTGSIFTGSSESGISLTDLFAPDAPPSGFVVNAILWRASLDTVSVLPLSVVDTFGGTIVTDWYISPDDSSRRIKVAIFVLDGELRADGLAVKSYLQSRSDDGNWVDIGRDPEFSHRLEDLILTRAREIRASSVESAN